MEMQTQTQDGGSTWNALRTAQRLQREAKRSQDALPPSLPSLGQSPLAGLSELISSSLSSLEAYVAEHLFRATDGDELDEYIGELVRDRQYHLRVANLRDLLDHLRPLPLKDPPNEGPPEEFLKAAGPDGASLMVAIDHIMDATIQAQAETAAVLSRLEEDSQERQEIADIRQRFRNAPLWFLHEPKLAVEFKKALYAGHVSDVCTAAVGGIKDQPVPQWLRTALLERWYENARLFLRYLAGIRGVTLPRPLRRGEAFDLEAIEARHKRAEQGYKLRLARARASKLPVYPPPKDGDDL